MEYERYLKWLSVLAFGSKVNEYAELTLLLWNTPYEFNYDLDKDRNTDGLSLRARYCMVNPDAITPQCFPAIGDPCSTLEALLGIAIRCDEIIGEPDQSNIAGWFKILLDNLTGGDGNYSYIQADLERWFSRSYAPDGRGGLFPLKNPVHDQRFIPTWAQMCSYLSEMSDK